MANGNFGGGDGTETNPYLIEDWADFINQTSDEMYYKLTTDLDGNDYNDGVWTAGSVWIRNLDGDNHTISNIYCGTSATDGMFEIGNGVHIKNLNFTNTSGACSMIHAPNDYTGARLYNCTFSWVGVDTSNSYFVYKYNNNINFENCAISISGKCGGFSFICGGVNLYRCHIRCDTSYTLSQAYSNLSGYPYFYMCRIVGKCSDITSNSVWTKCFFYNCVIAVECSGTNMPVFSTNTEYQYFSIINKDLAPNSAYDDAATAYKVLTTEQMQDLNYLQSIGFNVAEG